MNSSSSVPAPTSLDHAQEAILAQLIQALQIQQQTQPQQQTQQQQQQQSTSVASSVVASVGSSSVNFNGDAASSPSTSNNNASSPNTANASSSDALNSNVPLPPLPYYDPRNLYVDHLPCLFTPELFSEFVGQFGKVIKCKLIPGDNPQATGYGFVLYENESDAVRCREMLNNYEILPNKRLKVSVAKNKSKAQHQPQQQHATNLYVSGLPLTFNKNDLMTLFNPYGEVIELRIMKKSKKDKSREGADDDSARERERERERERNERDEDTTCIGFVRFKQADSAQAAIAALNGMSLTSNSADKLVVKIATDKHSKAHGHHGNSNFQHANNAFSQQSTAQARNDGIQLFVFHIPPFFTQSDIMSLFSHFGHVQSCALMRDPQTQESKGFAFVTMSNQMETDLAIRYLNGYQIGNKFLKVQYKVSSKQGGGLPARGERSSNFQHNNNNNSHGSHSHSHQQHNNLNNNQLRGNFNNYSNNLNVGFNASSNVAANMLPSSYFNSASPSSTLNNQQPNNAALNINPIYNASNSNNINSLNMLSPVPNNMSNLLHLSSNLPSNNVSNSNLNTANNGAALSFPFFQQQQNLNNVNNNINNQLNSPNNQFQYQASQY